MSEENKLSDAQKARIERNKVRAQSLRQAKLVSHPYNKSLCAEATTDHDRDCVIKIQGSRFVDSGGGFLVEQCLVGGGSIEAKRDKVKVATDEPIAIPVTYEECLECGDAFVDSFLFNNFAHAVCDKCYDGDGKKNYSLIRRSDAKGDYLLKDCDFDKREPPLRYISRKNPHNSRWGEMKLYLHSQVEKRAMEVWGSEEELERQHGSREEKREISKVRKYNKNLKELRMEMRSSLYTKKTYETHQHEFGPDNYNEEDDTYTHTCLTCPYTETFEKL